MSDLKHNSKYWKDPKYAQFVAASKQCRRVGTAHATGDSLRAMYASLIAFHQGFGERCAPAFFKALLACQTDKEIADAARIWLRDLSVAETVMFENL